MAANYSVSTTIARPRGVVFDAVVDRVKLCRYFTDTSSGDLVEGERVVWNWAEWGDHPVTVRRIVPDERIELVLNSSEWNKTINDGYDVVVVFEFETSADESTLVRISETGWKTDDPGLKASHENCGGWMHMLMCLKAFVLHELDLR